MNDRLLYPLSYSQQSLWLDLQMKLASPHYNEGGEIYINGSLDKGLISKAVNYLIANHEILRTRIINKSDNPMQYVAEWNEKDIPFYDLTLYSEEKRTEELNRILHRESRYKFDFEKENFFRCTLIQLEKERFVFTIVVHHIIADGITTGLITDKLSEYYNTLLKGEDIVEGQKGITFKDFVYREREWVGGKIAAKQLAYWKKTLDGCSKQLKLPTDFERPQKKTFVGNKKYFTVEPILFNKLKDFSRKQKVTLNMTILAGLSTLYHFYSNQNDILIGTPIANRNWGNNKLFGHFVNPVVIRTDFSLNPTFEELIKITRKNTFAGIANHKLPFIKVVRDLGLKSEGYYTPLIQVMFTFLSKILPNSINLGGIEHFWKILDANTAKFDIDITFQEFEKELTVVMEYDTSLFKQETITKMYYDFETLLMRLISNPDRRISIILDEYETQNYLDNKLNYIF
ncbi:condensation domain-containing protein [Paucisalibacillus sp. EB02]|uniref:condensation domain-containing protein n=1 Tax=Paucisalibacillus sp. EB02 TaxID=1347087 RepID=UPI0005A8F247|nr:condensation domain-containing protein [Paucisalibacillus sp. EB02]